MNLSVSQMLDRLPPIAEMAPIRFSKTVGESDVYLYAGITGDLHPNHVNVDYMRKTPYGERIAHGSLIIGYTSAASTLFCQRVQETNPSLVLVSYGYDRIRFIGPVKFGDTVFVTYRPVELLKEDGKIISEVEVRNQEQKLVAVLKHILKALPGEAEPGHE